MKHLQPVKGFQFEKLYKAVQAALKLEDDEFVAPLHAIKKQNEPAVKKVILEYKDKPKFTVEAYSDGNGIFVRILDADDKVVEKTRTVLITDCKKLVQLTHEVVAEKKASDAAAAQVVAKRQIKPIPVVHKDFAQEVMAKAGKNGVFKIKDLKIEIILKDPAVLQHVPNGVTDLLLAQKIGDAADIAEICLELTTAFVNASNTVKSSADLDAAEAQFKRAIPVVVANATKRAAKPIADLVKMGIDQKHFQTETHVALVLGVGATLLGATATAVSILTAPLHLGVATVASAISTLQSVKALGDLIISEARGLEATKQKLDGEFKAIKSQYENASKTLVGTAEVGKTLVNSLIPNFITNINSVKALLEQFQKGLVNRELKIHKIAAQMGDIVEKAQKAETQLDEFLKKNNTAIDAKQKDEVGKAIKVIVSAHTRWLRSLEGITQGYQALTGLKKSYGDMEASVARIASGKPTWAEVTEVMIGGATAAGFLVAGNISSPDAYKGMEAFNMMAGMVGNTQGSMDLAFNLVKGVADSIPQ